MNGPERRRTEEHCSVCVLVAPPHDRRQDEAVCWPLEEPEQDELDGREHFSVARST